MIEIPLYVIFNWKDKNAYPGYDVFRELRSVTVDYVPHLSPIHKF